MVWSSGCSDDDSTEDYIGVWIGNSITVTDCNEANAAANGFTDLRCSDASCYRLEIKSGNEYSYQQGLTTETGTWSTKGGLTLCIEEEGDQICETYDLALTSSTLTISTTNESTECVRSIIFLREVDVSENTGQ